MNFANMSLVMNKAIVKTTRRRLCVKAAMLYVLQRRYRAIVVGHYNQEDPPRYLQVLQRRLNPGIRGME